MDDKAEMKTELLSSELLTSPDRFEPDPDRYRHSWIHERPGR